MIFILLEDQALKDKKSCILLLQHEWYNFNKIIPIIINYIKINTMWKIYLQTHKYLNIK